MLEILAVEHDYPIEAMVRDGFDLFYRLRHDVTFFDDVFPVLEVLRTKYRLGSISNGNASAALTPLNEYFDFFINAVDVMARKPDAKIYRAFCEGIGVAPAACVYIGDDPEYDVVGARDAGLKTIWINRQQQRWPAEIRPASAEIKTLTQLLDLL